MNLRPVSNYVVPGGLRNGSVVWVSGEPTLANNNYILRFKVSEDSLRQDIGLRIRVFFYTATHIDVQVSAKHNGTVVGTKWCVQNVAFNAHSRFTVLVFVNAHRYDIFFNNDFFCSFDHFTTEPENVVNFDSTWGVVIHEFGIQGPDEVV